MFLFQLGCWEMFAKTDERVGLRETVARLYLSKVKHITFEEDPFGKDPEHPTYVIRATGFLDDIVISKKMGSLQKYHTVINNTTPNKKQVLITGVYKGEITPIMKEVSQHLRTSYHS